MVLFFCTFGDEGDKEPISQGVKGLAQNWAQNWAQNGREMVAGTHNVSSCKRIIYPKVCYPFLLYLSA